MPIHDLILVCAGFMAGFCVCFLLRVWADHRARPYREGWEKSYSVALSCQMREAYRQGQQQGQIVYVTPMEAPAPYEGWRM